MRQAGENLDLGDTNEALGGLGRALSAVRQGGLTGDPLAADVEALLATTLAVAGRPSDAAAHFRAALRINPRVAPDRRFAGRPLVQAAFQEARGSQAVPAPRPGAAEASVPLSAPSANPTDGHAATPARRTTSAASPTSAAPPPPVAPASRPEEADDAKVVGIRARAVGGAEAGRPLAIQARVGEDVGKPARMLLFYRAAGGRFQEVPMAANGDGYRAAVPGQGVQMPSLQYYVEARDGSNRPLARRGNPDRPLAIAVVEAPVAPAPAPVARKRAPAAAASRPAPRPGQRREDEENPFDSEHDPTKVVPKSPK
jgi:hypothetical protein